MKGSISGKAQVTGYIKGSSGGGSPPYTGEYDIVPKVDEEVILQTKNRQMTENVLVRKIPQYEVSNSQGGETLIIGGEENGS